VPQIRLALAQLNPVVGDLIGNSAMCLQAVTNAAAQGADVVVLPEMIITGYPVEDLALRPKMHLSLLLRILRWHSKPRDSAKSWYLLATCDGPMTPKPKP